MKKVNALFFLLCAAAMTAYFPNQAHAFSSVYPNMHGKSLTTPVAWGNAYGTVYAGAALTTPAPYTDDTETAAALGVGIGNPYKNLGIQATLIALDPGKLDDFTLNVHAFRNLGNASAIGAGVENIDLCNSKRWDIEESYYVVFSHSVGGDAFVDTETNSSRLHFSIGAGNGRFGNKSDRDIAEGKGEHGTYVFGNVAYEVFNAFNVIADWNGVNLNTGISKNFFVGNKVPVVITLGAADLTDNSGDGVRLIAGIGTGFML
jgi:hypothetical protein